MTVSIEHKRMLQLKLRCFNANHIVVGNINVTMTLVVVVVVTSDDVQIVKLV